MTKANGIEEGVEDMVKVITNKEEEEEYEAKMIGTKKEESDLLEKSLKRLRKKKCWKTQ